jgi:hypothetical protein
VHPEHLNGGGDATGTDPGDKARFKCCGVCTATAFGLLPPSGDMSLARSTVVYSTAAPHQTGISPIIDPGIPKRTI